MNNNLKDMYSSSNDELYTPRILVEPIIKYIPEGSTVWCPCDTKSSEFVLTLKEHGIDVIHSHIWEGKDFLSYEPDKHYDCIITNPPFTLKLDIFKRLISLQKPFAILMNSTCEQYQVVGNYFYELSEKGIYIQKLTPDKKVSFNGKTSSFNTAYFCWSFLPRDNMYCHLEHNNSGKHYVPSRMYEDTEEVADLADFFSRGPPFLNNKDRKIQKLINRRILTMNKNYINNMKVLNLLFLNRRTVDGETYCPFSQTEMAIKLGLSTGTVHNCIRQLSNMGYMQRVTRTCRKYTITEEGRKQVKKLK